MLVRCIKRFRDIKAQGRPIRQVGETWEADSYRLAEMNGAGYGKVAEEVPDDGGSDGGSDDSPVTPTGGGVFFVSASDDGDGNAVLDKTYAEIVAAAESSIVVLRHTEGTATMLDYLAEHGHGLVSLYIAFTSGAAYYASSEDDYPSDISPNNDIPIPGPGGVE